MQDPLDVFFETGRHLLPPPGEEEKANETVSSDDNQLPMRAIEEQAIAEDVQLVRKELKDCISGMAAKIPALLELAMMMQEPEMIDSTAKMIATLSKVSTDLIGIDLRILQESKKVKALPAADPAAPAEVEGEGEMTTAEAIRMIRADRVRRQTRTVDAAEDVEAKSGDTWPTS